MIDILNPIWVWREDFKDFQIFLFLAIKLVFESTPVTNKSTFHQKAISSQVN